MRLKFLSKNGALLGLFLSLILFSCHKEDVTVASSNATSGAAAVSLQNGKLNKSDVTSKYSADFLYTYYSLLCRISQTTQGFFPPEVARAYGYVGIAAYESVVNGITEAKSLAGQLNGLVSLPQPDAKMAYNWAICSNAAVAEMVRDMFGRNLTTANRYSIDSMENITLTYLTAGVADDVKLRSVQYGKDIAAAVYVYSKTDGGNEVYLDPFQLPYTLPPDASCWLPTGSLKTPISPKWGSNRPFLQADVDYTAPDHCAPYSTEAGSSFYTEALSVYNQVKNNTPDEMEIAKYWADDPFNTCTPTGHTFNILTQLLRESKASLEKASVAYAKLSIAENDAFIACWKSKYQYVLLRPETYIRKYIDPNFSTVIGTPAFPSYVSGHSCEIGAGSRVFTDMFTNGSGKYNFVDQSQLQYGFVPRMYSNFDAMAKECADSRFYAGIHYPMDNENGLKCGRAVGDFVVNNIRWPKNVK